MVFENFFKRGKMNLLKVAPLIGIMVLGCHAEELKKSSEDSSKKEPPKITVYSLFVKNPSYQRLANNIEKVDTKSADVSKALALVTKESFKQSVKKIEKKEKIAKKDNTSKTAKIAKKEKLSKKDIKLAKKSQKKKDIKVAKKAEKKVTQKVASASSKDYLSFVRSSAYPKTFAVYKNDKLLKMARKLGSKIVIDRKTQRIKLVVNGKVAIDSPCTTGSPRKIEPHTKEIRNKETPKGVFRIQEKIADKRSTIFGKLYRYGKVVFKGDRRKYDGPPARYEGASLKNWMRLTSSGIGIHGSHYIKRHPASNGCVRVPYNVVGKIFSAVKTGTKVIVR